MPIPLRNGGCLLVGLLASLLFIHGCGRKAPPKPPQAEPLPVVKALTAELAEARVRLSWTMAPLTDRLAHEAEFVIYRDALSLAAGDCPTCPPQYELVAQLPYDPDAARNNAARMDATEPNGGLKFQYIETVAGGYRYRYQVALRLVDGRQGEPSKSVEVTFD
jgi:hypothetical protein